MIGRLLKSKPLLRAFSSEPKTNATAQMIESVCLSYRRSLKPSLESNT